MAAAVCAAGPASEPAGASGRVTPVLAPDPEVMKIIDGLGEGESALLPPLKTTGDINGVARHYKMHERGPGSRDYCIKMAWMPERRRAIFCGANHGAPHRLNDVWEYDLPSNTWACLYGPDSSKQAQSAWDDVDFENIKDRVLRTKRGGPAIIGHVWWQLTYDPEKRAMLFLNAWSIIPNRVREDFVKTGKHHHQPPLWAFYPEEKKWEPIVNSECEGQRPGYSNGSSLEYLPELGGSVWTKGREVSPGTWLYNSRSNTWKDLAPNGGSRESFRSNACGGEAVMAYLPDRKMLVSHLASPDKETGRMRGLTAHYSVEKNEWRAAVRARGDKDDPLMPMGHDAHTNFAYDRVGKVCLLWAAGTWCKEENRGLFAYDPETGKWSRLTPKGPPPQGGLLAYYDPARNVFVIAGKWVYRHRKTPAKDG